jgi:DNA (cytosine-5)-methyltransferase 1
MFVDRTPEEEDQARHRCKRGKPCVSCGISLLHDDREEWTICDGALVQNGITYHVNDFVYYRPQTSVTDVYIIGQIIQIHRSKDVRKVYHSIDLRVYQRCDLIIRAESKAEFGQRQMDEVRLVKLHLSALSHYNYPFRCGAAPTIPQRQILGR